ncbi:MAG: M81 family metallopeptidase [Clostridia bacterium]|nr:M81 family metallopeptidase [Clostridia bacterium]
MKRILVAGFKHETNRFCPHPADMKAYGKRFGEDVFRRAVGTKLDVVAFLETFHELKSEYELVPVIDFDATPSGPVTRDVYELAVSTICNTLTENGPFDGVLLSLHGAMAAEHEPDGEGAMLERIRGIVGKDVPIIGTLDLHTNCTRRMAENATALIACREYPHTDSYQAALRAAQLMRETLEGKVHPRMGYCRVPYLLPLFPTEMEPLRSLNAKAREMEKEPGVLSVRINHGFFLADIADLGMSVLAITDGDAEKADRLAKALGKEIWDVRGELVRDLYDVDAALDEAERLLAEGGDLPVVIADASDNVGSGAIGDTTHFLRRVMERGITGCAISNIHDPASSERCFEAGVGAEVELDLGGWSDPAFSGGPVHLKGRVRALTDGFFRNVGSVDKGNPHNMGRTAVIESAGNTIIITSKGRQAHDPASMLCCGVIPSQQRIIIVKSAVHYRAGFGPISRAMLDAAAPGYAVPKPDGMHFVNWRPVDFE